MSKNIFGGVSTEQAANVEAAPVVETQEVKVDGETEQEKTERTYTGADLEQIVKDRLKREQKKLSKQYETRIAELETRVNPPKVSPNVEEDLRSKLSKIEEELKVREAKLTKFKTDNLRSTIEKKFASADCLDPELVVSDILSRGLVRMDEDDEIVVENASGQLDDLVKDYLDKKPHLRRGTSQGGIGTKGPSRPAVSTSNDLSQVSTDELLTRLGGSPKKANNIFGR